jgi:hypothetical protein
MHVSSNTTPLEGPRIHSFARKDKKKNKKELSCQKLALFGALLLLLGHEEVTSIELKVCIFTHGVRDFSVESPTSSC